MVQTQKHLLLGISFFIPSAPFPPKARGRWGFDNCPLDMLIERHMRDTFPALRPSQFLSSGTTIRALPAKVHPVAGNC